MFNKIKANPRWFAVSCIVQFFMLFAAYISFGDITTLAIKWGVPAALAWTAPLFIDGLTWMGKFGRSSAFAQKTRTAGLTLMAMGGTMSLTANILVGETIGMRVYGALVVIGYITAEWYSTQLEPKAPAPVEQETTTETKTAWVVTEAEKAARKRAGYANKSNGEKAKWTRDYRAAQRRKAERDQAVAPTSPGRPPVAAPTTAQLEAAVR